MSLQDELKALKQRIAELEGLARGEQGFPQSGDNYWYINPLGIVLRDEWSDFVSERYMIEIGNVFKTEQDAHFAVEKLKVEAELRKYSHPYERGRFNYYLFFDIESDCLNVHFTSYCPPQGAIYFESEEKAQQAIKSVGEDRIKKYIFGVED